jgi:ABC-type dipeptide/oligopeptide/nickel transport system ATPase component
MSDKPDSVLSVRDLKVCFASAEGPLTAINGVSFDVPRGRTLALVGESGCGKSVTAYSILRLVQSPGRIAGGSVVLHSKSGESVDITTLPERSRELRQLRGGRVSMIFQEPMTALSPVHTIGAQISEAVRLHRGVPAEEARRIGIAMLSRVGIPRAETRYDSYSFQFSGGMRQRVMIAIALACQPELVIADEPTTALDVTIQAQILALLRELQRDMGLSVLLITHDLGASRSSPTRSR